MHPKVEGGELSLATFNSSTLSMDSFIFLPADLSNELSLHDTRTYGQDLPCVATIPLAVSLLFFVFAVVVVVVVVVVRRVQ